MSDHIIEVRSEEERRQYQRRLEDQVRTLEQAAEIVARERRAQIYQAAIQLYVHGDYTPGAAMLEAVDMWDRVEQFVRQFEGKRERQGKDESK